jgi:hypothetical protein
VETGEEYFDLRGVLVQGVARRIENPAMVTEIGRQITATVSEPMAGADPEALTQYVERAARKRYGYRVEPIRVISWDHSKLQPSAP